MTHDELLGKIDETSGWINSTPLSLEFQTRLLDQYNALRAVVELHKPMEGHDIGNPPLCEYCLNGRYIEYPCDTIQAIQEQLK